MLKTRKPLRRVAAMSLAFLLAVYPLSGTNPCHADQRAPDPYEAVNQGWDRLGSVYGRIVQDYYTEVEHNDIVRGAIDGMLERLDIYSQYYDEDGLRRLRQDTTGRFAGLGVTVGIKDRYPVVIAPIADTPAARAGLVPGDQIIAIEGHPTLDMSLDDVVNTLRGDPGTAVSIRIAHPGISRVERDISIQREVINIRSVEAGYLIRPQIGYIGMRRTRFSEPSAGEVERAIEALTDSGAQSLILDLRGNPGGLLSQAAQVADLFLQRGAPIVSVRERNGRREQLRRSQRDPAATLPLVVLIDGGSASAAEIVAGAIQDNDRGVLVGTTSFGKGSVQTIFDLHDAQATALKLTTARYYTPSGRSIHRDAPASLRMSGLRLPAGSHTVPARPAMDILLAARGRQQAREGLQSRFALTPDDADALLSTPLWDLIHEAAAAVGTAGQDTIGDSLYTTRRGRRVSGGGGISPDISVPAIDLPEYVRELRRRRLFFDFVIDYVAADSTRFTGTDAATVTPDMLQAFLDTLAHIPGLPAPSQAARAPLGRLGALATQLQWSEPTRALLRELERAVDTEDAAGLSTGLRQALRAQLRAQLALRLGGRANQLRVGLEDDPQIGAAIEVLRDDARYAEILALADR